MSIKNFGELSNDNKFIEIVTNFSDKLIDIEKDITTALNYKDYDKLSTSEKVRYDTYLAYSINSLFWMHQKLQGIDTNSQGIKNELARVQQSMLREKSIKEKNTIRPVLDKKATDRFVHHGLHIKMKREDPTSSSSITEVVNKKIKFDD